MVFENNKTVAIIGGCGHVGLPLGIKFALANVRTVLVDVNSHSVELVNSGQFPFLEKNGEPQLKEALNRGLRATGDPEACKGADVIVFVTGTPVDEHLNPKLSDLIEIFSYYGKYFTESALIVMRSTLFPGTMEHLRNKLRSTNSLTKIAFCPERVAQGFALEEIECLPQIESAFDDASFEAAKSLFATIAPTIVRLEPLEAELAKLMANSWRYIEFAIANQFYMIAESKGVDFYKILAAIKHDYPRASGYKSPGFTAGPCLFKDTMQLASYFDHQFYLGHSAMLVNEGLASFSVEKCRSALGGILWGKKVAILGLTFKANNDDTRESLSYKVCKALRFYGADILEHDPYVAGMTNLTEVLEQAAAVIICTPHDEYKRLNYHGPLIDVWGITGQGLLEVSPGTRK